MLIHFLFSAQYCSYPWTTTGDSCILEVYEKKTWQEASDYCIGRGGHLPSIENNEENNLIYGKFQIIFLIKKFIVYFEKKLSD